MYEELVKRLRRRAILLKEKFSKNAELLADLIEAANTIEELSLTAESYKRSMEAWADEAANAQPRWIPVTERLPEEDGDYLTLSRSYVGGKPLTEILGYSENLESVSRVDFEGVNRNGWYDYDSEVGYFEVETITHWMPLPSTEGLNEA